MTGIAGSSADRVLLQLAERFDHEAEQDGQIAENRADRITSGDGSFLTPRRRKPDSNSWSRFEKSRPYKTRYTESESCGRRERHHSEGGTKS
jgi:hypothetical protein